MKPLLYVILALACAVLLFPFLYVLSLSFKHSTALVTYPPDWIPRRLYFGNYFGLLAENPFPRWLFNSFAVAGTVTILKLAIDSLAAYAFAKLDFPFKESLFLVLLATLMLPFAVTLIPMFLIVCRLGLQNTYAGLILPGLANPVGIFMMRQFMETLPRDLDHAARLDGCNEFSIYWRIVLPLCRPALVVLAIFTFMTQWTSFLWPLVITQTQDMRVLTVGLASLKGQWVTDWGLIAAGAVLTLLPIGLVFVFLQRHFVAAGLAGALKE